MASYEQSLPVAMRGKSLVFGLTLLISANAPGADIPKMPVPISPYVAHVYRYADTMLDRGRDTYGPHKTGLFLSALDRATLQPLTNCPPAPTGVREQDRVGAQGEPLTGASPAHDENLLRLLYTLTELTTKTKYREAADSGLQWVLSLVPTSRAYFPSGTIPALNVFDDFLIRRTNQTPEFFRPWMLWDSYFRLASGAANWGVPRVVPSVKGLNREAGFLIRTWAVAYANTKDISFLNSISTALDGMTDARSSAASLSLAIDCDGAAHHVPEPLASRLRTFAARRDAEFCALPHKLKETSGFLTEIEKKANSPLWQAAHDQWTTAQIGMMCVSRYDNTGRIAYRDLVSAAADAYLNSLPEETADVWPGTFGQAISLEVAAWRHTARQEYFDRARKLADVAIEKFLDKSPLPRASFKSEHYESITGADTLMLALLELHLNVLHITAVRCPPNTIDR